jgi:hypothetical protein
MRGLKFCSTYSSLLHKMNPSSLFKSPSRCIGPRTTPIICNSLSKLYIRTYSRSRCQQLIRDIHSTTNQMTRNLRCLHHLWTINPREKLVLLKYRSRKSLSHRDLITDQYRKWTNQLFRMQTLASSGSHLTDILNSRMPGSQLRCIILPNLWRT